MKFIEMVLAYGLVRFLPRLVELVLGVLVIVFAAIVFFVVGMIVP